MLQAWRPPALACSLASESGQPSGLPAGSLRGRGALPARLTEANEINLFMHGREVALWERGYRVS